MSSGQQQVFRDRSKHTKDIVVEQVQHATQIGKEAVVSGAYLYPIEGAYYLLSHPRLWKPLQRPLLLSLVASIVVTGALFLFTYLPQAAIMCLFNGPLGFVTVVPLILSESGAIVLFMARALWLGPAMEETFDAVLFQQGMTQLVSQGREVQGEGSSKRLGKALSRPLNRFTKEGLVRYILSLPLNAIPIVGTIFFLFYNGKKSGPSQHERYFQLKKMSAEQKAQFVESRRGSYTA
ncbi:hypothetical protein FRC02_001886 [Tulasnella sp. 418]|nr:hypothetical protein FRC02_001886 [Tulasnella sp. 418]